MTAQLGCEKVLLVQAEFDGELDAAETARLAAHRADCSICRSAATELSRARTLIGDGLYHPMPDDVRGRVMARIVSRQPRPAISPARPALFSLQSWHRRWDLTASFGFGVACTAAISLLMLAPREPSLVAELVSSHVRALQPGHLEDVPSSDKHTVQPWFDGRIDFAPPVKGLAAERFPLRRGRLVGDRPVVALVYQRDKHLINLFVWPSASTGARAPENAERHGYNVVHWSDGGMTFWAVSDLELGQLREFAEETFPLT